MSAVAVFAAFVVGRIIIDNVEELVLRERETIARCVSRVTAGPQGPKLNLATALHDVGEVNRAFANPNLGVTPRAGWRYRATLVYKPGIGQEAFFRALRLGPRLASMMGTVCVDLEEVAIVAGEGAEDEATTTISSADEVGTLDEVTQGDSEDAEYDIVAGPCRRATLAEFYTLIRPAMHRIAVDATPASAAASRRAARVAPRPVTAHDDDGVCSICMDGTLEVVTQCGHAYCEECYLRWLAVSRECPLCRQRLGRYDAYALVDEGELVEPLDGDSGDGRTTGRVGGNSSGDDEAFGDESGESRHGAEWLRGRLAALPSVVEEADGRRARIEHLLRRLKQREGGKEGGERRVSSDPDT